MRKTNCRLEQLIGLHSISGTKSTFSGSANMGMRKWTAAWSIYSAYIIWHIVETLHIIDSLRNYRSRMAHNTQFGCIAYFRTNYLTVDSVGNAVAVRILGTEQCCDKTYHGPLWPAKSISFAHMWHNLTSQVHVTLPNPSRASASPLSFFLSSSPFCFASASFLSPPFPTPAFWHVHLRPNFGQIKESTNHSSLRSHGDILATHTPDTNRTYLFSRSWVPSLRGSANQFSY